MLRSQALLCFIIVAFTLLGSCKSDTTLSQKETETVRSEVTKTLHQYHLDIQREGVLAELKYLDSSDSFSWMAPGINSPLGYDSVVSILKMMDPLYSRIEHSWDSLTVQPQSKSRAMYEGTISSILITLQGDSATMTLKEKGIIVKRESGWKLLTGKTQLIR